jgi:hypothetical protein
MVHSRDGSLRRTMDPRTKKTLLIAFSAGAGVAVVIAALVAAAYWSWSRPRPPKPWNTTAIVATGAPGFSLTDDGKKIRFSYSLENKTDSDYKIASAAEIKVLVKYDDKSLSQPMPTEVASVEFPVFIPARQAATIALAITFGGFPQRKETETDEEYHEALRAFLLNELKGVSDFAVFDETNRYEINLPKPAAQPSKKAP